jgi:hypothetical protein
MISSTTSSGVVLSHDGGVRRYGRAEEVWFSAESRERDRLRAFRTGSLACRPRFVRGAVKKVVSSQKYSTTEIWTHNTHDIHNKTSESKETV